MVELDSPADIGGRLGFTCVRALVTSEVRTTFIPLSVVARPMRTSPFILLLSRPLLGLATSYGGLWVSTSSGHTRPFDPLGERR